MAAPDRVTRLPEGYPDQWLSRDNLDMEEKLTNPCNIYSYLEMETSNDTCIDLTSDSESLVVVQPIMKFPTQLELHELVCTQKKFRKSQSIFSVETDRSDMFHDEYEELIVLVKTDHSGMLHDENEESMDWDDSKSFSYKESITCDDREYCCFEESMDWDDSEFFSYKESITCDDREYCCFEGSIKRQDDDHKYRNAVLSRNFVVEFSSQARIELIHYMSSIFSKNFCRFEVNSAGLKHHCSQFGVTLIIPEGAVQQLTNVWFGACAAFQLSDRFEFGNYVPVTSIVWLYTDKELIKPAKLSQPHNIDIDTIEKGQLTHLVASDKNFLENHYFQFIPSKDEFEVKERVFETSCHNFCSKCISTGKDHYRRMKKWYSITMAQKEEDTIVRFHFCIFPAQEPCYELVVQQFGKQEFKIMETITIKFDAEKYIMTKFEPNQIDGWLRHVESKTEEKITEEEADYFLFMEKPKKFGKKEIEQLQFFERIYTYPPRFRYIYHCKNNKTQGIEQRVSFCGLDALGSFFIFWQPKGRETSVGLEAPTTDTTTDTLPSQSSHQSTVDEDTCTNTSARQFRRISDRLSIAISSSVIDVSSKLNAKSLIASSVHSYILQHQDIPSTKAARLVHEVLLRLNNLSEDESKTCLQEVCTTLRDIRERQITDIVETLL